MLPGSLFFQVMPAAVAKICAALTAIANAELTLPFCKLATEQIDKVVKPLSIIPKQTDKSSTYSIQGLGSMISRAVNI